MRHLIFFLLVIVCHPASAQQIWGHHAATIKHKEFGVLEGDIGPGYLNEGSVTFKQKSSMRILKLDPEKIESVQIEEVGWFKSYLVEIPLYYGEAVNGVPVPKFLFLSVAYEGAPYSLLTGILKDLTLFFYEDAVTNRASLWQYQFKDDPEGDGIIQVGNYVNQLQILARIKSITIPPYILNYNNTGYNKRSLTTATKILNQDSGYTYATSKRPYYHVPPRWVISARTGYCFRRNLEDDLPYTGLVHEIAFAREVRDPFNEWFGNAGVALSVWRAATSAEKFGKPLKVRLTEFSIKPFMMVGLNCGNLIINKPTFFGVRIGGALSNCHEKFSIDGQVSPEFITESTTGLGGEFNTSVMLSPKLSVELSLGFLDSFLRGSSVYAMSGLYYRWH